MLVLMPFFSPIWADSHNTIRNIYEYSEFTNAQHKLTIKSTTENGMQVLTYIEAASNVFNNLYNIKQ